MHLGVQILFTVNVHAAVLQRQAEQREEVATHRAILSAALATGLLAGTIGLLSPGITSFGITAGEVLYRCFMSFYGLIVPAYVLIALTRRRARWGWAIVLIALALPAYWIAFVQRQMPAAIIGAAIVLVGAALSRMLRGRGVTQAGLADVAP